MRGEAVDHVAGVKNNQEEDHTQEEKGLGAGSLWSYFVQLTVEKRGKTKQFMFSKQDFFFSSFFYIPLKQGSLLTLIQKNQMPMWRMPAIDVTTKYMVMTVIRM